ncbi:hypothetical protein IG631_23181 [Alternaria alternata]|nr:hypothetical protein IG631_23181 [Alternaria alternata]
MQTQRRRRADVGSAGAAGQAFGPKVPENLNNLPSKKPHDGRSHRAHRQLGKVAVAGSSIRAEI